ncbi:GNAT family N-acetyltransferase [Chromobacterium sp. ATCC 53434]|uniref:GNAT family N-acetyltransferase n=1 Tax=Chromobacterium sp. (strain ATCC 53434 / SC 14030) TaxID=2059672 RepID=UPI000C76BB05|nr:GNAT family N-acetyltransferase [Chromobacterium sp. ATCC 53434]AUH52876.1 GNAT family N-acetyltransferase [Chromobacterium sp. ATCC 53434]
MEGEIRAARPEDASSLAALSIQVWLSAYAVDGVRQALADYVFDAFTPAKLAALIADPARRLLVIELNGHLLGYTQLKLDSPCDGFDGPALEMERLYLSESHTGRGLGRRLTMAARQWASSLAGQPRLWLTVWHRNARAIAFYRRMGMAVHGEWHFELEGARHLNYVMLDAPVVTADDDAGRLY